MQHIDKEDKIARTTGCVVILGNFDGLHRGHQQLMEYAKQEAKRNQLETVVFTFYPHPTQILSHNPKLLIMTRKDKKQLIQQLGMDILIEYPFTKQFATKSPEAFFKEILIDKLKARILVVGKNYYFGKDNKGDTNYLIELGKKYDIKICIVEVVMDEDIIISSSYIRTLILQGKIEEANELLGHPYQVRGTVMQGRQLGRTIGFPTINLETYEEQIYPPNGVYATRVKIDGQLYEGMTNIGYNPTVNGIHKRIETHLFNFNQMIYGKEVEVYFYHFIRPEQKFDSLDDLMRQLREDKKQIMSLLTTTL